MKRQNKIRRIPSVTCGKFYTFRTGGAYSEFYVEPFVLVYNGLWHFYYYYYTKLYLLCGDIV